MNNMKKALIITGILLIGLLVLQGCTTTNDTPEPTVAVTATAEPAAVVTDEPTTAPTDTPTSAPADTPTTVPEADSSELVLTLDELAQYDGQNGNPAYIAVDGVIYDVTNVSQWNGGAHKRLYRRP